ncbi:cell-envelope stress modulator CpxP [Shimwellia pseudoproteus]|uniref:cell-envelope stress modulator CpxP n=1 Tax=Shimwellia pseudoproteus TaxID=570012 RepID=UPI0018ECA172|nr:cell-envelope stress modulator CpxP [Shimwellia pseudoproteus]MBJ3815204.1 cell-envelope stress modulator CpxP [Shimwellia pseudoproteus]
MRNVIATVTGLTLMLSSFVSQSAEISVDNPGKTERVVPQLHMFDGISLTEHQRQQMRDLMQQARHDKAPVNVSEIDAMHRLITAEKFDEAAVRRQAEKMAQQEIQRQVDMAKVRNQMYRLLTPEQQAVLNQKHQQRMEKLHELAETRESSPLQLSSHSARNQ